MQKNKNMQKNYNKINAKKPVKSRKTRARQLDFAAPRAPPLGG